MKKLYFLLFLAFIEGASVMACELLGAKMIAPFFGSSLYVWASVLGITLFGLMTGYYTGGYLSEKIKKETLVYWILLLAGVFLAIMPYTSVWVMTKNLEMDIRWGSTLSLLVFMFPPLVLMGMTSPVIINMINTKLDETGRRAGSVYAISTLGGIVATFLVGFYMLPEFGIKWPCFIFGFLLMIFPLASLLKGKSYSSLLVILPFFFLLTANIKKKPVTLGGRELVYESEGVFGQIRVYDAPVQTYMRGQHMGRTLYVNSVGQSTAFRDNLYYDSWDWSYYFPTVVSMFPKGSKALLMGLGGGTIVHQYNRLGFDLQVVEIDKRIKETAINYFAVSPNTNITIDDARHYINTCQQTYDVITFDMFLNETPPAQVLSLETFKKVKQMLNPNGLWVLNYFGYTSGSKGKSARSILKTLKEAGFHVEILVTPSQGEEDRNIIFLSSHEKFDFSGIDYEEPNLPRITDITQYFLDLSKIDLEDAEVLTDARPRFDKLYLEPSVDWRKRTIGYVVKPVIDSKQTLIK